MANEALKKGKRTLIIQVVLFLALYIVLFIIFQDKIPTADQLVSTAEQVYQKYGYLLIFTGALIEAIFLIGSYIPGSFIVLLGASLSNQGITSFPWVIILGTIGFTLGYCINYFLGRFGWFKIIEGIGLEKQMSEAKKDVKKHFNKALFLGYMMTSTGSIVSTLSGVLKISFKEFLFKTLVIQTLWSLLLGGLAYIFGIVFIKIFLVYFGTVALITFLLYSLKKIHKKKSK